MAISYNGLWKLLIDKNKKKTDLIDDIGISSSTLAKMSKVMLYQLTSWKKFARNTIVILATL